MQNNTCGHEHHHTEVVAIDLSKWTATINKIARDLHNGKLKPSDLDPFLVTETFNKLESAAQSGYGKDWIKFDAINSKTVQQLRSNLYLFSGVKIYQQLTDMNNLLVDKNGKIRNFNDFKKEVFKIHKKYNRNYLQAEYQTAKASAQMARKWQDFERQKHLYPNLIYKTVGDDRVRQEHVELNGIIKPIDDKFWDVYYPPNGWRCRCTVTSTKKEPTNETVKIVIDENFSNNVGKTKELFVEKKHPYFTIPKSDKKDIEKKINGLIANNSAKRIIKYAKTKLVGKLLKAPNGIKFTVSNTDIKTIVRKAHKDRVGRNNLLYNLQDNLTKSKFVKVKSEGKNREKYVEWNYFKITKDKITYYFNIAKLKDGRYKLHAITDTLIK